VLELLEGVHATVQRLPVLVRRALLPTTDLGVAVQAAAAAALLVWLWWLAGRRGREWRLVVVGSALVVRGLFGLRAVH